MTTPKEPTMTGVKDGPGPKRLEGEAQPNGAGPPPSTDYAASMRDVLIEQKPYMPSPNVVEYFLTFSIEPEAAWIRAGLSRQDLERKRRIVSRLTYVMTGSSDPLGSLMISLAGIAGLDGRAIQNAKDVLTNVKVLPPLESQLGKFQNTDKGPG